MLAPNFSARCAQSCRLAGGVVCAKDAMQEIKNPAIATSILYFMRPSLPFILFQFFHKTVYTLKFARDVNVLRTMGNALAT